jgi:lipopolysaccharide biosynthesis glycosyltransferase
MTSQRTDAVCLCVDARMLVPAFFVADGVRRRAGRTRDFDIIVLVPPGDVDDTHRRWAAERDIVLCEDIDASSVQGIAILQSRLSTATLVKLLLPQHFAQRYRKILYLDADLVIAGDVGRLFDLDIGGRAVAAVPTGRVWVDVPDAERDRWLAHFHALGLTPPYRFFNAGVLLIDVESWNREKITRRCLDFLERNEDICQLPDEDALNAVLDGDLLELSPIWNIRPLRSRTPTLPRAIDPVIVHYVGPHKPWKRFRKGKGLLQDRHAYRLYREFLRDTPWAGWLRQQWTTRDLFRAVRQVVKARLKRVLRRQPPAMTEAERQAQHAAWRQHLAETPFADVQQGITLREGSHLRLAPARSARQAGIAAPPGPPEAMAVARGA